MEVFNELFTRMQYEPSILMFGKEYQSITASVLDFLWNAVVTTNCDLKLAATFNNGKRLVRDITDPKNMQANILDSKNLHVLRLFGEEYPADISDLEAEDVTDQAVSMLKRVAEIIAQNGIILIEDFEEAYFTHKELRMAFRSLYGGQKQLYIFNCRLKDKYIASLEKDGIAVVVECSINDFFENYISDEDDGQISQKEQTIQLYIDAGQRAIPVSIEKRQLLETESFATLLNIELLNDIKIPKNLMADYFYAFLKNSVKEPQWYAYNYGFNVHRKFEDELYKKVKKGLDNVGNAENKPLLVVGQTGAGKSIALSAVAYKIFNEKKYPVIYIKNPDVNFYPNAEYKKKGITRRESPAFNALDALIENLENLGAKATLIVWDASSYSTGRKKCYRLFQALQARGRKIYLVSTAYELNNHQIVSIEDDEYMEGNVLNDEFIECHAKIETSTEADQLRNILLNKCNMQQRSVDEIINCYVKNTSNYLSMLYQAFDMLKNNLSVGVSREANNNMRELDILLEKEHEDDISAKNLFADALKKIEDELISIGITNSSAGEAASERKRLEVAKDDFIKSIAVCSQFKLKMPYDFALRILGTYNTKIIKALTLSTFFVVSQDCYENYEISLRTALEAQMYIQAKNMTELDEIDCIIKMLEKMKAENGYGQQREVRLCEKLIRIIGPNNRENGNRYRRGYTEIINALQQLREERDIWEPILISQEITYIREYYGRNAELPNEKRISYLEKAISIADEILDRIEVFGASIGTRNAIIVESANSKLLLYQLKGSKESLLYKELRRDLIKVIRYDSSDYHAYVTLLKGLITEYNNETDQVRQIELLESMCSVADEIIFENPEVANSEYFQRKVTEIYSYLENNQTVNLYVEELVANGSSAGVYVMAKQLLQKKHVDFKKDIENQEQLDACKQVYDWFHAEHYKAVLEDSEPCQYMFLNIVWLMNNKKPIYSEGECWKTKMNEKAWREILAICNGFIIKFCNDAETIHQLAKNIRYIKALCLGELKQYSESIVMLRSIEEDSSQGLKRVFTKHLLCEEDGTPRKFIGRLGKYDEIKRSGSIYIDEFGKNPIYYHGPNLKTSNLIEGITFDDIEIGYSNIAPKAYREI